MKPFFHLGASFRSETGLKEDLLRARHGEGRSRKGLGGERKKVLLAGGTPLLRATLADKKRSALQGKAARNLRGGRFRRGCRRCGVS